MLLWCDRKEWNRIDLGALAARQELLVLWSNVEKDQAKRLEAQRALRKAKAEEAAKATASEATNGISNGNGHSNSTGDIKQKAPVQPDDEVRMLRASFFFLVFFCLRPPAPHRDRRFAALCFLQIALETDAPRAVGSLSQAFNEILNDMYELLFGPERRPFYLALGLVRKRRETLTLFLFRPSTI